MRHTPFFRWVLTLGVVLVAASACVYIRIPDPPELRQVDLTVIEEDANGRCTVRWTDPFEHRTHEDLYLCDIERDPILKAPEYDPDTGFGWDTAFVLAEGRNKGQLYQLEWTDEAFEGRIELSDELAACGLLLTAIGLVGGNLRALTRLCGVRPGTVRQAERLERAALLVAEDHDRAVDALRSAYEPWHAERVERELSRTPVARLRSSVWERLRTAELEDAEVRTVQQVLDAGVWGLEQLPGVGRRTAAWSVAVATDKAAKVSAAVAPRGETDLLDPRTTAVLVAARVLVEAGPEAGEAAETGRALAVRLQPLLAIAAPASGYRLLLAAGPAQRRHARMAVVALRQLLAETERDGVADRFRQASVDLLRGQDGDPSGLGAWADFESRPAEYHRLLTEIKKNTRVVSAAGLENPGHRASAR
ncbi:hypothetical protein AB0D35_33995 [Streptomyces sp. NPDC048301]|uniref:hypothetical protein n=1 Tax=unclassified Streptomyces TaxID=2593676 RepID=UPI003420A279